MNNYLKQTLILVFWLAVWETASLIVGNEILLCGPWDVAIVLVHDVAVPVFWGSIFYSMLHIFIGFFAALILGFLFTWIAYHCAVFKAVIEPALMFLKSVPVVCIIVLLLIWFGSSAVSSISVFLVVFPAIYFSVSEGLRNRDAKMLELFKTYGSAWYRVTGALTWPSILPFLYSTCKLVVGMSWKAGVAAELIGLPLGSIGEHIYQSKITLSSSDLFAWTLVIVLVALLCEKVLLALLRSSEGWLWRASLPRYHGATGAPSAAPSSLDVRDLEKGFGGQMVVDGFTHRFDSGSRTCVYGPSGCGKTTLLKLLLGSIQPDAGEVRGPCQASVVFQESRLCEKQNAVDNVRLFAGAFREVGEIRALLEELLPADALDKPVSELSGGMRRRVEIVRALAASSDAVFLDEPFANLDEANIRLAADSIMRHLDNRTLVVFSHDLRGMDPLDVEALSLTFGETGSMATSR